MKSIFQENPDGYIFYDFQKFWKIFPVRRSLKENVKTVLFTLFPQLFKNWAIFQNWKYARVFRSRNLKLWHLKFWERSFFNQYTIKLRIPDGQTALHILPEKLAVVIHAFYPDIFSEILNLLSNSKAKKISLYVTGPEDILAGLRLSVPDEFSDIYFLNVKNHGRDILPFLQVLPKVFADGHTIVLKMHTKKSNHLNRKEHWRNDLLSKLIGEGRIEKALQIFSSNPAIGIIGPSGNILPMQLYYAANGQRVNQIASMMGVKDEQLADLNFVAGSMFYARKEALLPVLNLNLTEADFEPEDGQKDGTMAHVVERAFAVALIASGFQLADTDFNAEKLALTVSKVNHFIV